MAADGTTVLIPPLVYSKAGGAGPNGALAKMAIDTNLSFEQGISTDRESEEYWRAYISQMSKGSIAVHVDPLNPVNGLQMFLVKDGIEGFIPLGIFVGGARIVSATNSWRGVDHKVDHDYTDAEKVNFYNPHSGHECEEPFDANDALIVFDAVGRLPKYVNHHTAFSLLIPKYLFPRLDFKDSAVGGGDWDNRIAKAASPNPFTYQYYGISILDPPGSGVLVGDAQAHVGDTSAAGLPWHGDDGYYSDIHEYLGTVGCIMVNSLQTDGNLDGWTWGYYNPVDDTMSANSFAGDQLIPRGRDVGAIRVLGY